MPSFLLIFWGLGDSWGLGWINQLPLPLPKIEILLWKKSFILFYFSLKLLQMFPPIKAWHSKLLFWGANLALQSISMTQFVLWNVANLAQICSAWFLPIQGAKFHALKYFLSPKISWSFSIFKLTPDTIQCLCGLIYLLWPSSTSSFLPIAPQDPLLVADQERKRILGWNIM